MYLYTASVCAIQVSTEAERKHDKLVPMVLVTMVFPMLRVLNIDGALTSYQSFFVKGSTLQMQNITTHMYDIC